ncbi:DUF485 domain-containing protein [Oceanobacillus sp. FSL H7-0719]|uniref:DUF485 domain-containing protein n=1 Tax=Oceanobacillus sp. FSL H7-0719 TaxID=2954507 RepID=UPI003252EBA8
MNTQPAFAEKKKNKQIDFVKVEESKQFKKFMRDKKKFIIPMTIFFLIFYFLLPIFTSYTSFLNTSFFGDISWVWVFAFAQFIMTWVLCTIYVKKAGRFDEQAEEIVKDQLNKGGNT